MQGFDFEQLKPVKEKVRDSTAMNNEDGSDRKHSEDTSSNPIMGNKPSKNVLELPDGQPDTSSIKKPVFTLDIELTEEEIKKRLKDNQPGVSIFSKSFDGLRRSWHLKVDIEAPENRISVWLVERGEPENQDAAGPAVLRRAVPIKFSSVLCELEVLDPAVKNRKSVIFFSFAHDRNQVIGHRNYLCLDQL